MILIAYQKKLFDEPDARKIHDVRIPRIGGLVFAPVILFSIIFLVACTSWTGDMEIVDSIQRVAVKVSWAVCAVLIMWVVGMADDLVGVRYVAKFGAQLLCGFMLLMGGAGVTDFEGFMFMEKVPEWVGYPLTVFFFVLVVNAINLIDGIDGLASGLSVIAFVLYGIYYLLAGDILFAMISFASLGVLVPFYYFNVFGSAEKRKKIFMGDTGSLTIGFLMAFLGLNILTLPDEAAGAIPVWMRSRMVIVLSPLLLPCLDVFRVYMHRLRMHSNPFLPDRNHIHHKLLALGTSQTAAMLTIVCLSLCISVANICASCYVDINIVLLADILLWTVWNVILSDKMRKDRKSQY